MQRAEKRPGKWNHYKIRVQDDSITVSINGTLVNQAGGLEVGQGPIGLQSEGGEIHFRNIELTPLP
jgi:hypothetical protein